MLLWADKATEIKLKNLNTSNINKSSSNVWIGNMDVTKDRQKSTSNFRKKSAEKNIYYMVNVKMYVNTGE